MAHGLIRSQNVIDLATSADTVPVFNPALHTMVFQDTLQGYPTFASMLAANYQSAAGAVQDTSTDPAGSNLILPGQGGVRIVYDGVENIDVGSGQNNEGHSLITPLFGDAALGMPGSTMFLSFESRLQFIDRAGNPTGFHMDPPIDGTAQRIQVKHLELWNSQGRAQFMLVYSLNMNSSPRTSWGFLGNDSGTDVLENLNNMQAQSPWPYEMYGQWMKHTIAYRCAGTGPYAIQGGNSIERFGNRTGIGKMWTRLVSAPAGSDTLIVANAADKVNVTPPNAVFVNDLEGGVPMVYCGPGALDYVFVNLPTLYVVFGATSNDGALRKWAIDLRNVAVWREGA